MAQKKGIVRVCIVDDHSIVRDGLKSILQRRKDIQIADEIDTGKKLLEKLESSIEWDLIILDLSLPDISGFILLKEIRRVDPRIPIIVLTMHTMGQSALRVLQAGANGFLSKDEASKELITAIDRVRGGQRYISEQHADILIGQLTSGSPSHRNLSNREFEILCLLVKGKSLKSIGKELKISDKTVSTHKSRMLEKLELKTTTDLIRYALENNLI